MLIVSACLTGEGCRYNGKSNKNEELIEYLRHTDAEVLTVCPEQLGGLPTPRAKAEIEGGADGKAVLKGETRVITETGEDVTEAFVAGAKRVIEMVGRKKVKRAILKSKSPSCGCGYIYDGTFSGKLIPGSGVTAALLMEHGINVITEDQLSVMDTLEDRG